MTLYVVYLRRTGHVVGAVNAVGVTLPTDVPVASLVGDALPLRVSLGPGEMASLPLPAVELAVHKADDEPRVFADPLEFGTEPGAEDKPKPALTRLTPWEEPDLALSTDSLVITVPDEVSQNTPVLVVVAVGQAVEMQSGTIAAGRDSVDVELPVTVPPGPHGVLALVAGRAGALRKVTKAP